MLLIESVRNAIREELDATNTYDSLMDLFSMDRPEMDEKTKEKYLEIIKEIKDDEINHTGRLMNILFELDPEQVKYFNAGLKQKEN